MVSRMGWGNMKAWLKGKRRWAAPGTAGILILAMPLAAVSADVVSIWGGARGTVILKSDGTVWTWGAGSFGKLGINTTTGRSLVPVEVHGAANIDYLHSVTAIMGGESHNMALKSDGTLW